MKRSTVPAEIRKTCKTCFRIVCRGCGWIANEKDGILIRQGILTACPLCGWKPEN